jgi:hypothetical protein
MVGGGFFENFPLRTDPIPVTGHSLHGVHRMIGASTDSNIGITFLIDWSFPVRFERSK